MDRLCFAADMIVSKAGALKSARFYPAVMRSAARLTYTLANEALFEGRPAARTQLGALTDRLLVLVDVYRALYKARSRRGALDFDAAEAEFVIDAGERVRAVELRVRNDAHRLIEECMIEASKLILGGFALRVETKIIEYGQRYTDPRGDLMWNEVLTLINDLEKGRAA